MHPSSLNKPIIISGGGIGGISAALALAKKGFNVTIYEPHKTLSEVGAGLQLGPNATRILARLDILNKVEEIAVAPQYIDLVDGQNGKRQLRLDIKAFAANHWHAPYLTVHRAHLHETLATAALNHPKIQFKLNRRVENYKLAEESILVDVASDKSRIHHETPLLIGADGVWSKLRALPPLSDHAQFSGYIAWRTTIKIDSLPPTLASANQLNQAVSAWMGRDNHIVTYPISANAFNIVAITKGQNPGETWCKQGDSHELASHFSQWSDIARNLLALGKNWTYWPLFKMTPMKFQHQNKLAFIGDAAHAFLPFAAQGAAMAIEDGAALADCLAKHNHMADALGEYESMRMQRVTKVEKRGNFNGFVYHVDRPLALVRNLAMRYRSSESFMRDMDWLYQYDGAS